MLYYYLEFVLLNIVKLLLFLHTHTHTQTHTHTHTHARSSYIVGVYVTVCIWRHQDFKSGVGVRGAEQGKSPDMMFCAINQYWLQLNRNCGQGRSMGGGGGCRSLVSEVGGAMTPDVLLPPLTPTPASPLTLLPN